MTIDANFIIKYTNALYSTSSEYAPTYDEFRDMFSSGQIRSKQWILRQLAVLDLYTNSYYRDKEFIIVGSWFGTLGIMIKEYFRKSKVTMLDIDPRCEKFINNIIYDDDDLKCLTKDMYEHSYKEDVIINTSCEHIEDIKEWLLCIPLNRTVILQSNNFIEGKDHINCVNSVDEFISQAGLVDILYSGELKMPMYTRYMIIGKT